jgi:hypothetical protein
LKGLEAADAGVPAVLSRHILILRDFQVVSRDLEWHCHGVSSCLLIICFLTGSFKSSVAVVIVLWGFLVYIVLPKI